MVDRERTTAEWPQEGRHWVQEGVYDAALECGQKALAQLPGDPEILFFLGKISEDLDRLKPAREYFEQILAVNPTWNDGAAARALAGVQRQLKSEEEAWLTCQQWPCAETFFSGAICLRHLGLLEEALSDLDSAASNGWDREDVLVETGEVHMELGDFQAAVDCFGEALEIDPRCADSWYAHAAALRKLVRYREAMLSIERSLQLSPTASARWLRGVILDALGESEASTAES